MVISILTEIARTRPTEGNSASRVVSDAILERIEWERERSPKSRNEQQLLADLVGTLAALGFTETRLDLSASLNLILDTLHGQDSALDGSFQDPRVLVLDSSDRRTVDLMLALPDIGGEERELRTYAETFRVDGDDSLGDTGDDFDVD